MSKYGQLTMLLLREDCFLQYEVVKYLSFDSFRDNYQIYSFSKMFFWTINFCTGSEWGNCSNIKSFNIRNCELSCSMHYYFFHLIYLIDIL